MKLGGIPVVWGTIVALMYQWSEVTRAESAAARAKKNALSTPEGVDQSKTEPDQ